MRNTKLLLAASTLVSGSFFFPTASSASTVSEVGTQTPTTQSLLSQQQALGVVVGMAIVLVVLALVWAFFSKDSKETPSKLEEQIKNYGVKKEEQAPAQVGVLNSPVLVQAKGAAAQALAGNKGLEARVTSKLEAAASNFKPAEWVLMHTGIVVAAFAVSALLSSASPLIIFIAVVAAAIIPWVLLGRKAAKRRKAFHAGLADTLQLMSGSLQAGLSLAQSVDTIVREGADPISSEFKRVLVETRLGVSLEDALEGVALRMKSEDFTWVVMAIKIQREVGGNLAELLVTVAATLREREYLRRHVSALSAEGRLSGVILAALPPVFGLYLVLVQPDYIQPLFTDPRGWVLLGGAGVMLSIGIFWMSKVVKVEL